MGFEPTSEGQKLLHTETLHALNEAFKATRLRMDAARTELPSVLWVVVVLGAAISLSSSFFFKVEDARVHGIMVIPSRDIHWASDFHDLRFGSSILR